MTQVKTNTTKQAIDTLLDELPPESLVVVRRFVEFLRQQADQGQFVITTAASRPPYLYPTVSTPASSLQALPQLLDEGYEGDALADTESLYDGD
jgi:hypothetical protein